MQPELAVGLPAAGAAATVMLRPRPRVALAAGLGLGAAGLAAIVLNDERASNLVGVSLSISPFSRALLIAAAASLAVMVMFAPARTERSVLLAWGLAAIAGMAAVAAAPSLDVVVEIVLAMAILQAATEGKRPIATRLRAPALAAALLAVTLLLARAEGPALLSRFVAVGLVAGLVAAVGLLPYIHEFDPEEATWASPISWIGFAGPVLAVAILARAGDLVQSAGGVLGALLIGIGLVNVVWGTLASWRTASGASAWHYSFMADWGLVLCGLGVPIVEGRSAAVLVFFGLLLGRLPLYIWSRQALRERVQTDHPVNLLVAAMLAGAAPFAGFAARVLLLRSATELFWPLALVLAVTLLFWLPSSLRLGRSLGLPKGRQLAGVSITLAINVAIGLYPEPVLRLAGL